MKSIVSLSSALLVALASAAWAQPSPMVEGEVRKLDREQRKVTLKHGEIRNLDMPPMTMVFGVTDPALLEKLAQGAKVRFSAEKRDGQYVVTAVEPAK